ncbi:MAG: L-threonylcarbamoyladenylate synthase [Patescibacteria group bacterium]|nr:L-threonylcarbamoyladenylate synthase [Patescibacteria group bacterium]
MNKVIEILSNGGVGVLLTDTLYGLVGSALDKEAVGRVQKIKNRSDHKPLIVLISSIKDLDLFGVKIESETEKILKTLWPGKVSIILPCKNKKFVNISRGSGAIAFRFPNKKSLISILKKTGPLVAPSANPEGFPPAKNITEAKKYFGNNVDFYFGKGVPNTKPSTLIKIDGKEMVVLRK